MLIAEKIKSVMAVVILICFFLPLAQCSPKANDGPNIVDVRQIVYVPNQTISFGSFEEIFNDIPLFTIFTWPLGFVAIRRFARTVKSQVSVSLIEVLLVGGSLYFLILSIVFWGSWGGKVMYGGVIVITAYVGYLLTTLFSLFHTVHEMSKRSSQRATDNKIH